MLLKADVIPSEGGRYDALLKAMWPKAAAPVGAVGVTVAADGLVARVAAGRSRTEAAGIPASQVGLTSRRARRCQALTFSTGVKAAKL